MRCVVDAREVYAYTGTRKPVAAQPTIVFVHGAANDHSVWSLQSRYFAYHGYNVLAVDLPGHGKSGGPPLPSVEAIAAWLGALLTAAGVGRAMLVGHSLGSLAVLDAAAQMPERVQGIALLGPAVPMAVSDVLLDAARTDESLAYALINSWSFSATGQLGTSPFPGIALAGNALQLMKRSAPGVLAVDLDACRHYANGIAAAGAYRGPALVLMGARDQMAPPKGAQALIDALATPRVALLPATGHALMAEQPDAVLDALIAFATSTFTTA
jgi:pimeloyl-ACP methyl ester carboxylesterase